MKNLLLLFLLFGCGTSKTDFLSDAVLSDSLYNLVRHLNNITDEGSNITESKMAPAANCARPVTVNCTSSTLQSILYSSCTIGEYAVTGTVELDYSTAQACTDSEADSIVIDNGESVVRTADFGFVSTNTTYAHDGTSTFSRAGGTYTISLANTITKTTSGQTNYIHTYSSSNLALNQIPRSGRQIATGNVSVSHSNTDFTAAYSFSNVSWGNGCCHPTSGSIDITLTGTVTNGTGTLTFTSTCGSAELDMGSGVSTVNIGNCY